MGNVNFAIFIGVISGVFASMLVGLFLRVWKKIVIPWYEERVYKGVILSGNWELELNAVDDETNVLSDMHMIVDQKGHFLKGSITVENKHQGMDNRSYYNFTGRIRDVSVMVNYFPQSRTCMGVGMFLLKITGDGDRLVGSLVFIEKQSTKIKTVKRLVWNREK